MTSSGFGTSEQETFALLQEEIARLEDELRIRDAEAAEQHAASMEPRLQAPDQHTEERIARLTEAVAAREETIALLLEQIRLADEAEASSRAEWEQLHQWVEEVERRVEEQGGPETGRLREELAAERRKSEALRQAAENQQRSSEIHRQTLVTEVERLRARFKQVAGESDTAGAAVQALEHENQELREAYETLTRNVIPQHEVEEMAAELHTARQDRDAIALQLKRLGDDRLRERNEHEAAMNALRSQLARESLHRQEEHVKTTVALPDGQDPLLEADRRIRAFREHLKEIHHDEAEQRTRRSLAARLSRLWHHTSPS